jgi:hypothetical protein
VAFFIHPLENNMPRWPDKTDSNEQDLPKQEIDLPTTGKLDLSQTVERDDIVVVGQSGLDNSYAAQLAFLEEKVDVLVHESTDPNAEPIVPTAVNGVNQFFPRGQVVTCKRKFVEVLARSKVESFKTKVIHEDGNVYNRMERQRGYRYPFSVVRDDNPKGHAWLKSVMEA